MGQRQKKKHVRPLYHLFPFTNHPILLSAAEEIPHSA